QLDFGGPADIRFVNTCLPDAQTGYAIFGYWYDLNMTPNSSCSGCGVYTSVSGSAPNRIFNVEYRSITFVSSLPINFTIRLYEGQQVFDVIYSTLSSTPTIATIGTQNGGTFAQYQC